MVERADVEQHHHVSGTTVARFDSGNRVIATVAIAGFRNVIAAQNNQGMMLLFEDLAYDNVRNRNVVVTERCPFGVTLYLAPINCGVPREPPQPTSHGESLVDFTNRGKPIRVNRRLPRHHFGSVSPNIFPVFYRKHVTTVVSIKHRLVVLAREVDDDILNSFLKRRVTDQPHIEIVGLPQRLRLTDSYDGMLFEERDNV